MEEAYPINLSELLVDMVIMNDCIKPLSLKLICMSSDLDTVFCSLTHTS